MINFIRQRYQAASNILSIYFASHPLRSTTIFLSMNMAVLIVYAAIWAGFRFLIGLGGMGSVIISHLFYLLFFIMFFMVALSFAILYYNLSFRSKETKFLVNLPIKSRKISFLKFIESSVLAGWIPLAGFIIFIAVYSNINNLTPFMSLFSFVCIMPFLIIASAIGYLLCITILKFMNLKKGFVVICVLLLAAVLFYRYHKTSGNNILYLLSEEIIFFKISKLWFLPFSWAPWAIVHTENGNLLRAGVFLINLWSLSLLMLSLIYTYGGKVFRDLFFKYSLPAHKRSYHKNYLDKIFFLRIFPVKIANFILKDIKMFIREPVLWTQFLIFFGLLFFYFVNLQKFSYNLLSDVWKNLITFLNAFSVLCISSALTIRFVFPQWSMEGKNYWILKLSPVKVRDILTAKFILSFSALTFISMFLILLSDKMLGLKSGFMLLTAFITAVSIFSLTSFSLGLGAYFADFKKEYYLKAVESIGGVITLIVNFSYVVITIFGFTFVNHIFIIRKIPQKDTYM
ncbi:MAG: hypothetical protein DRH15_10300, partial [Deltaproteobacteria bacterium]